MIGSRVQNISFSRVFLKSVIKTSSTQSSHSKKKSGIAKPNINNNTMAELTAAKVEAFKAEFNSDPKNKLAQNVAYKFDPLEVCVDSSIVQETQHAFQHKIADCKPISNQKNSGRCWIFACLNVMRNPFMKKVNIEDFEFSQSYLFFWDKVERMNYFLHTFVEVFRRGEPVEGRLVSFLLSDPTCDGGQWDMLTNLIEKYGVIPRKCFAESHTSCASRRMNLTLKSKVRGYAKQLQEMVQNKASDEEINKEITKMVAEVYRICSICLGTPPSTITWEYHDKNKAYHKVGPIAPKAFYEEYVKPVFNLQDKICIVNDPRPNNGYGKAYTVEYLSNMVEGRKTVYNNQPIELLKKVSLEMIKSGEPVWFGCDVGKHFTGKTGLLDLKAVNYDLVFGVTLPALDKANRLIFGESLMTHAMVLTGVSTEEKTEGDSETSQTTKWRIENSWGEERGDKGYLLMTDDWFSEFVYEVVVDKKFLSQEIMDVLQQDPVVLPAWDPMGSLA
ncbi:bleomycin hydrolase-like [Asterias amurensis]|uniref:bleomycin hydrolase-like n=1 Tax=Asterias amurensis TaxID=7602 RepID=UPI003AB22F14